MKKNETLGKQSLEVFYKKDVLENFVKFTGKRLCLFFNKVAGLQLKNIICMPQLATSLRKEDQAQVFHCGFCEIFKNTISIEYLQWLPLNHGDIFTKVIEIFLPEICDFLKNYTLF